MTNILEISASGRKQGSLTRQLTGELVEELQKSTAGTNVIRRDLSQGIDLVSEDWIAANFTPEEQRSREQQDILSGSDRLVDELKTADIIVIGAPIYNFGVPAALKAWVDMIARARMTFRYTENGPEGLLSGKKAYVVVASGGVAVDSEVDFATPYLRQALRFIGIDDIEIIPATQSNSDPLGVLDKARSTIAELVLKATSQRAA